MLGKRVLFGLLREKFAKYIPFPDYYDCNYSALGSHEQLIFVFDDFADLKCPVKRITFTSVFNGMFLEIQIRSLDKEYILYSKSFNCLIAPPEGVQ